MSVLLDEPKTQTTGGGSNIPPVLHTAGGGSGNDDDIFQVFHRYKRIVRRGMVPKNLLECDSCGTERVTRLGKDDSLVLWCPGDDTETIPGQDFIRAIRGVVGEWYVEEE